MIRTLLRDHDKLRACAATLRALIDDPHPCDMDALSEARWDLAGSVMKHLAAEDRHLYANLDRHADPEIRTLGKRYQDELKEMFAAYSEHAKRWTPERIVAEWPAYRAAVQAFLVRLLARIDAEERELYPLAVDGDVDIQSAGPISVNWAREAFAIKDRIVRRK